MKNYRIIGLTGQSGAGKSTVAELIKGSDICVINADKIVSELYSAESACLKAVCAVFDSDIINADGSLNRPLLAKKAFSSKENTELLNSVVHPFVVACSLKAVKSAVNNGAKIVVFDAPQLFECNADVICDAVIGVVAPFEKRLERICSRDNISTEQAELRINAQHDEAFFIKNSDYIIKNDSDIGNIKKQIDDILSDLR